MNKKDIYKLVVQYRLTDVEQSILEFLLSDIEHNMTLSIREVAKINFSSPATIIKLAKKMGFSGYTDMIYRLYYDIQNDYNKNFFNDLDGYTMFHSIHQNDINHFKTLIQNKAHPILICGSGFSHPIATYFHMKLITKGYISILTDLFSIYENKSKEGATVIVISQTGQTGNINKIVNKAIQNKMNIVLFTSSTNSTIWKNAIVKFYINEGNKFNDQNKELNLFYPNCILFIEYLCQAI